MADKHGLLALLDGGFHLGSLNIIAARHSMGKTALALNIAQSSVEKSNAAVLIFSLELSAEQIARRMAAAQAEVSLYSMITRTMSHGELDKLTTATKILEQQPIFVDDTAMLTTSSFRTSCRAFKEKHPNLGLIVVDYLQIMTLEKRTKNRHEETAEILRDLKDTAKELNCPILVLSQLPRKKDKGLDNTPTLSDLHGTPEEAIEQFADTVMFLHREDYYYAKNTSQDSEACLIVAKNDGGQTGEVSLTFQREFTRLSGDMIN